VWFDPSAYPSVSHSYLWEDGEGRKAFDLFSACV